MAKYSPKMYAKALVELISGKQTPADGRSGGAGLSRVSLQIKKNIAGFLDFLAKNGDMKKAGRAVFLAENLFYEKTGQRKIILETARKIEKKNLLKDFFQQGDMVKEKINPELIAGIKIMINSNKQLDFSLSKKLNEIFT